MTNKHNLRLFDKIIKSDYLPEINKPKQIILNGILSKQECDQLIELSKPHYETLANEFTENERQSDRVLIKNKQFAQKLFEVIKHYIPPNNRPFGFDIEGEWLPKKVNSCLRFSRYQSPSIGFSKHTDSNFIKHNNLRSIFTVLIYLNDDFEGGETVFYTDPTFIFRPLIGSCIIFNHNTLHEGRPVTKGTKYIIRTDIVFERLSDPCFDYLSNPDFIMANELFREAINQELDGNIEAASELYKKQLEIRQSYI